MSWFKKKEKEPCTYNTLCIHVSEDVLLASIDNLVELDFLRKHSVFKKNRVEAEELFDDALRDVNDMIFEQYPWIKSWELRPVNRHHRSPDYFLDIIEHTLFEKE